MFKMCTPTAVVSGACLFLSLWLVDPLVADSTFTVSSFIPQKFIDLEWYLAGGFRAWGETAKLNPPPDDARSSYNYQNVDIASSIKYRYQTIQRYFICTFGSGLSYRHQASNTDSPEEYFDKKSYESTRPAVSTILEFGQYAFSDFFISGTVKTAWSYSAYSSTRESESREQGDYKSYDIDPSLYIGWGRSYEGQYSATALYIIKELTRNALIEREPAYQEMLALTEIIYQYRLKHVIDARQHKIEALTHIMDFLLERGIIDHANPRECLFIADVWDYFPRPSREFGWQLKLGAGFRYSYDNIQSTFTNDMEEWASYDHEVISYRMPYIAAIATYAQPFSLCWQVALYGDFTYVYDKEETDTRSHISYPGGELPLYHYGRGPFSYCTATLYSTLKYIYDSRTSGAMGPSFQIRDDGVTRATFYGFGTQVEYRISLPTTLGLKWTVGNSHYGTHRSGAQHSAWNHDITIDITHYLF